MKAGQMEAVRLSLLLLLLCFGCYWDCEVCRIRTLREGEECRLLYREGGQFVHQCDSRFSLKTWNDTVFLHLTSLTVADTGNYTCECSRLDGTYILYLNITVKEPFSSDPTHFSGVILPSGLTATVLLFIIICGMVKVIHRRHLHCGCVKSEESGSYVHGSGSPTDGDNSDELYRSLQQSTGDLYQTITFHHHQQETETPSASNKVTVNLENLETNSCEIYENLSTKNVSRSTQFDNY